MCFRRGQRLKLKGLFMDHTTADDLETTPIPPLSYPTGHCEHCPPLHDRIGILESDLFALCRVLERYQRTLIRQRQRPTTCHTEEG
jgi:hypothetical protein